MPLRSRPEQAEFDPAWLRELLKDAENYGRLTDREDEFISGIRDRVLQYGDRVFISPKQLEWLKGIEAKIHAL